MQTMLYIEPHKKEVAPKIIHHENLGYFYDTKTKIGVQKKRIDCDLKPGIAYDFTFDYGEDEDTYCFVVLKRNENIYYLAEYYDGFYKPAEEHLGDVWVRCDVLETFGIDLESWENSKTQTNGLPDMRSKIEEYLSELDTEISRCESWLSSDKCSSLNLRTRMEGHVEALTEVRNDLLSRLNELI